MESFPPRITICVGAVVQREDQILFVRQTYGDLIGAWSLPWGFVQGALNDGQPDPPDVAALRETLEEGGITAEIEGLLGIQNHISPAGEPRLYILFLCRHVSGDPTPDQVETDKTAYFSLADLDQLAEPIDELCAWVARRVLCGEAHVIPPQPMNPYHPHRAYF